MVQGLIGSRAYSVRDFGGGYGSISTLVNTFVYLLAHESKPKCLKRTLELPSLILNA